MYSVSQRKFSNISAQPVNQQSRQNFNIFATQRKPSKTNNAFSLAKFNNGKSASKKQQKRSLFDLSMTEMTKSGQTTTHAGKATFTKYAIHQQSDEIQNPKKIHQPSVEATASRLDSVKVDTMSSRGASTREGSQKALEKRDTRRVSEAKKKLIEKSKDDLNDKKSSKGKIPTDSKTDMVIQDHLGDQVEAIVPERKSELRHTDPKNVKKGLILQHPTF